MAHFICTAMGVLTQNDFVGRKITLLYINRILLILNCSQEQNDYKTEVFFL